MTDTKRIAGGAPNMVNALVSADQDTIIGDGSRENPLRSGSGGGGGTFQAAFRGGSVEPAPGMAVFISFVSEEGGVTTVQLTDVRGSDPASGVAAAFASVDGVIASVNLDGTVQVQTSGFLTLTTDEWDDLTGGSGGLTQGRSYFPTNETDGTISSSAPTKPGDFITRIGTATNATTMLLLPTGPVQKLGDSIFFAGWDTIALPVGSVVYMSGNRVVAAATSDISVQQGQAAGVVAALDVNGDPIVQFAGIVTLTVDEWDVVTNSSPPMKFDSAYYVDTSARPGHLTVIKPEEGALVQVGIGISTTELLLSAPFLDRLT